jgi:hypothetical protein
MRLTIVTGSHRLNSESLKVGRYLAMLVATEPRQRQQPD